MWSCHQDTAEFDHNFLRLSDTHLEIYLRQNELKVEHIMLIFRMWEALHTVDVFT